MDDKGILDLYWARSEAAISETAVKYGRYCHSIAYQILHSAEDSEECVNETWMKAWESMPPKRPERLSVFLGKITRNLSLNRYRQDNAQKRGGGQVPLALEELQECVPAAGRMDQVIDDMSLAEILNEFLAALPTEARKIFMRRYWYLSSVREIAEDFHIGESKVKMTLLRARNELKSRLEKEGIAI
ncbi:MAG: RNA polymerase sigma factor [Lachnospiraceae bacterium]|nr:RNA polymerase sigma factor [Lachnospiraceae bacterium]